MRGVLFVVFVAFSTVFTGGTIMGLSSALIDERAKPDPLALPVSNAVAAPSAPSFGPDTRPWFPVPEHMRGDNSVIVHFVSSDQISAYCSPDATACYHRDIRAIFMPNPCEHVPDFSASSYTQTLCHELAHANGWLHEIEAATPTQGEDQ